MIKSPAQKIPSVTDDDKLAFGLVETETVLDCVEESVTQPLPSIISIVTTSPSAILPIPTVEKVIVFTPDKD